jgi:hypothetical protein
LTQNTALFLWLTLSLQLVTKTRLCFGQVNRALGSKNKKSVFFKASEKITFEQYYCVVKQLCKSLLTINIKQKIAKIKGIFLS